jgi:WD40 repeat protein
MVKKKSKPTKLKPTVSMRTCEPPEKSHSGIGKPLAQPPTNAGEDVGQNDPPPFQRFKATGRKQQPHRQSLWCVTWADDIHFKEPEDPDEDEPQKYRYLATCGTNEVTIYEVEIGNAKGTFLFKQRYKDIDDEEKFYACVYGGRSRFWPEAKQNVSEGSWWEEDVDDDEEDGKPRAREKQAVQVDNSSSFPLLVGSNSHIRHVPANESFYPTGPQLLCAAGERGVIKVIDPVRTELVTQLRGHGTEIFDLRVSPTNEFLLLSASVDESIRLWNLQSFACVAIFTGLHGHREDILSVSWHSTGGRFASAGKDKTIRIWDITQGRVPEALQASQKYSPTQHRESFQPLFVEFPIFATDKVHINYVDCVAFVGDAILSRSTYNAIVLWLPQIPEPTSKAGKSTACSPPNGVIELRTFDLEYCDIWFLRFGTDRSCRFFAMGNYKGEVDIWDMDSSTKRPAQKLVPIMASTIRMLAFSPDGTTLVACNDNACVCKWDIP